MRAVVIVLAKPPKPGMAPRPSFPGVVWKVMILNDNIDDCMSGASQASSQAVMAPSELPRHRPESDDS